MTAVQRTAPRCYSTVEGRDWVDKHVYAGAHLGGPARFRRWALRAGATVSGLDTCTTGSPGNPTSNRRHMRRYRRLQHWPCRRRGGVGALSPKPCRWTSTMCNSVHSLHLSGRVVDDGLCARCEFHLLWPDGNHGGQAGSGFQRPEGDAAALGCHVGGVRS